MDQTGSASESELQKAINDITKAGGNSDNGEADIVSAVAAKVGAENKEKEAESAADKPAEEAAPAADAAVADAPAVAPEPVQETVKADYGDPDLSRVKSLALADIRPLLEKVDLLPAQKFKIYREIIEMNSDKGAIEPAYNAAKEIAHEKTRVESLLYLVEMIDKLGIGA